MREVLLSLLLPLLVVVPRILAIYMRNTSESLFADLIATLVIWFTFTTFLYFSLLAVYKSRPLAGIVTSVILFMTLNGVALMVIFGDNRTGRYMSIAIMAILVTTLLTFSWRLSRRPEPPPNQTTRIALRFLLCVAATNLAFASFPRKEPQFALTDPIAPQPLTLSQKSPNIIYIIPDTLARLDVLRDHYGVETRGYSDFFKSHKFYLPEKSRSNYPFTAFSLASSLNMSYLYQTDESFNGSPEVPKKDRKPTLGGKSLHTLVHCNRVADLLAGSGYKIINVYGRIGFTERFDSTTYAVGVNDYNLCRALFSESIFAHIFDKLSLTPFAPVQRNCVRTAFSETRRIASSEQGPYFLIVHVWGAHPPFIFGPDGTSVNQWSWKTPMLGYRAQATYVLNELVETSNAILQNGDPNTIIIIQGDHGGIIEDLERPFDYPDSYLRFSNFCAIRLPTGQLPDDFQEDLSPVQIFPILLNHFFAAKIPIPPTKSFWPVLSNDKFFFEEIPQE